MPTSRHCSLPPPSMASQEETSTSNAKPSRKGMYMWHLFNVSLLSFNSTVTYVCMCLCMYECLNVWMYECMHACMNFTLCYVWMCECVNVWMYECMSACMHVCMLYFVILCYVMYECVNVWMYECMSACMYVYDGIRVFLEWMAGTCIPFIAYFLSPSVMYVTLGDHPLTWISPTIYWLNWGHYEWMPRRRLIPPSLLVCMDNSYLGILS